jgi:hypothetical protein
MADHGGPTLTRLQLVSVTTTGDPAKSIADSFGAFVVQSNWLKAVTKPFGGLTSATNQNVVLPALPAGELDVVSWLTQQLTTGALHLPADPTGLLYLVWVPHSNCVGQDSYHNFITHNNTKVAFAQICEFADLTYQPQGSMGHEIIEVISDPYPTDMTPGNANGGYYFNEGAWAYADEVADACNLSVQESGWQLAGAWSNSAAASGGSPCIPYPAGDTYYNVSPSGPLSWNEWNTKSVVVHPGSSVTITLTGWASPATTDTWNLTAENNPLSGPGSYFTPTLTLSAPTIQQGASVTLKIGAHSTDPVGATAYVTVLSGGPNGTGTGYWPFAVLVQ